MKHFVANSKNGATVYVNLIGSQASVSISEHPYLLGLVKELVQKTNLTGPRLYLDKDMGRNVGTGSVIETDEGDTIFYAQALKGQVCKRFVKNGKPKSTQYITVALVRDSQGSYELQETWIGRKRPPQPGTAEETEASRSYWGNHAFILDREPIKRQTLTKIRPY